MKKLVQKGFTLIELMIVVAIIRHFSRRSRSRTSSSSRREVEAERSEGEPSRPSHGAEGVLPGEGPLLYADGEVGFEPERNNRYAYFLAATGTIEPALARRWCRRRRSPPFAVDYVQVRARSIQTYGDGLQLGRWLARHPATRSRALALGNIDAGHHPSTSGSISSESRVFTAGGNCTADANKPVGASRPTTRTT